MTPSDNIPANALQVLISKDLVHGIYVNGASISHQPNEFVVDFYDVPPGAPFGEVLTRIRIGPVLARRLLEALENNVARYETAFGPILQGAAAAAQPQVVFDSETSS